MFTIEEIAKSYVGCYLDHPEWGGLIIEAFPDKNNDGTWWVLSDYGYAFPIEPTWLPTVTTRYAYGLDVA